MKVFLFWLAGIILLAGFVAFNVGCHGVHPTPGVTKTPTTSTPASLTAAGKGLDWIIVLAVLPLGVGLGLYFFLPETHKLSLAIAGAAGGVEVAALITRVSLRFVPWVAGGLACVGLCVFIYELWRNRAKLNEAISGLIPTEVKLVHG